MHPMLQNFNMCNASILYIQSANQKLHLLQRYGLGPKM